MIKSLYIPIVALFFLLPATLLAHAYKIDVELPQAAGKKVTLAYHYLDKIYAADTCLLDDAGKGSFTGDSLLTQGLYKILIDDKNHFDFLLGADQKFHLFNRGIVASDSKITGSDETKAFIDYLVFLDQLRARNSALKTQLTNASAGEKQKIEKELAGLDGEMKDYWEKIGKKMPGSFLYKFLTANEVPLLDVTTLPTEVQQNDSLLLLARFNYQQQHYWDHFDYTDERMLFTPFYKPKLETWFNKVLYPAYDSVKPAVYNFLDRVEDNPRIFQYTVSFFLNGGLNSNILGMDALFVDIAKDYYLSGKAFWASKETLDKVRENVLFLENNLIGKQAPRLVLENYDGEYVDLYQLDAAITIVLIFEPTCGHCKVFIPEFYKDVYLPYKDKGLDVFAIYSMDNREEWTEFLVKHNMFEWNNVWDPENTSRFKILYDARKTPGLYVLDRDKKIISKRLDIAQLKGLLKEKLK